MRNRRGVPAPVAPGIDVLLSERPDLLMEARVGIVAGPASVTSGLTNVIDALHNLPGVRITALFGPEHGVRGDAQAGVKVGDETDPVLGVPVYSLYGEHRRPTAAMLQDVDVLVVDLFDVGCRYWTYLYTMAYVLEAAAEHGKKVVVLDRPNPVGGDVTEGNVLDPDYASFVPCPIAMRTDSGEAARLAPGGSARISKSSKRKAGAAACGTTRRGCPSCRPLPIPLRSIRSRSTPARACLKGRICRRGAVQRNRSSSSAPLGSTRGAGRLL